MMEARRVRDAPAAAEILEVKPPVLVEILAEGPRRRTAGQKRKAASSLSAAASSSSSSKRLVKERNALNILPSGHNGPCTRARQFPGKIAAGSPQTPQEGVLMAETVVGEVGKEMMFSEDPVKSVEDSVEPPDLTTMELEFEAVRSRGVGVHAVPTSAGWFSWEKIHELEKHALPSFFNGQSESRTPEIYAEIRNSIIKKFHVDPQTPVEVKDLSEISIGELGARQEVMEFLDHWGLINFHPFPHSITDTREPEAGAEKTDSLLDQLYQFENAESLPCYVPRKQESSPPCMLPHLLPESAFLEDMMRPVDPSVEYHCNSCSGDCSRRRYHCQKQADFDLCAECYNIGKFGSGMTPADFILMESAEGPGVNSRSWTDQETLLLLEALELFGENWNEIAEHVATKTKAQCILHFLQMPIEDPFLEFQENSNDNLVEKLEPRSANKDSLVANAPEAMELENGMSSEQPASSPADVSDRKDAEVDLSNETYSNFVENSLKSAFQAVGFTNEEGRSFSFAEAGNPVMVVATFLAGLVDQDAVSISSRSSMKSMLEESPGTQLVSRHCFILEEPPNDVRSPVPESAVAAIGDTEAVKEEGQLPQSNGSAELMNQTNAASGQSEMKQSTSSNEDIHKPSTEKELSDSFIPPIDITSVSNERDDKPLPVELMSQSDRKDASNFNEAMVNKTCNSKELRDFTGQGGDAPSILKFVDDLKLSEDGKPESMEQSDNSELVDQDQQISELPKVEDTTPTSIVLKEEPEQKDGAASTVDVNVVADGDDDKKISSPKNDINISTPDNSHSVNNLKRAAVTILSAAAVKAKLHVDREEDQIRQLVSCLIEKQLRKMEIKLAFFPEMENLIMRAKEQTERARQKLINERAQIIAARLGLSQSSSRPYAAPSAHAKLAMGYINMSARPPSMAYQRPPPPRRP